MAEITTAIATASASGKELTLTQEQQLILQKHQLLVQQQQQLKQQKAQQLQLTQMQMQQANQVAGLKKFPNYRLLGRNIFDGAPKQPFFKKKVNKANTYYSRFIKQHPTMNLPLAFQKSVGLAEDKLAEEQMLLNEKHMMIKAGESVFANSLLEEALHLKKDRKKTLKKKKKAGKKRTKSSDRSSGSDSDSSSASSSSKSSDKSTKSSVSNNSSTSGEIKTTKKSKEVRDDSKNVSILGFKRDFLRFFENNFIILFQLKYICRKQSFVHYGLFFLYQRNPGIFDNFYFFLNLVVLKMDY